MENDTLSWRSSVFPILVLVSVIFLAWLPAIKNEEQPASAGLASRDWLAEVESEVLPPAGFQSKITLGDAVVKLAAAGVIDAAKFKKLYAARGGLPVELQAILDKPLSGPIRLTRDNAGIYLNILWPLGLANKLVINEQSPLNGEDRFNFASTGGWTLGREENGGAYFNKFEIVKLTPAQEALVKRTAENIFRPCCDNSTFFQDCNHGSAMFGLLQLGAAQGLTEKELYREALAFNSFWFPDNYLQTALYLQMVRKIGWEKVNPQVILSKEFSSASGWSANIANEVKRLGLVPRQEGGAACGV